MSLSATQISEIRLRARDMRVSIVRALAAAGSGHTAGSLGMTDIFAYLYMIALRHDPKNPTWPERDRVVLSNGHICPVLYAAMAHAGYFPVEEMLTLRKLGTRLQGHPHREFLPIVETSSGPLGEGLSQAVGMALADRLDRGASSPVHVWCVVGDGELDEGQNWEAALLAAKEKTNAVTVIVDRNKIQLSGETEKIMPLAPLGDKWRAFGWNVIEIDGHDILAIDDACTAAKSFQVGPTVIIANTIPGKGVSWAEGKYEWHGIAPGGSDVAGAPPKEQQVQSMIDEIMKSPVV